MKGFTFVELIVVITIIIVITALGIVSFTGINKRSRDSRRISDLRKVSIALEVYRQEVGSYPDDGDLDDLETEYIDAIPTDPKGFSYDYDQGSTIYEYTYRAQMEDLGSTNIPSVAGCGGVCSYEVRNP